MSESEHFQQKHQEILRVKQPGSKWPSQGVIVTIDEIIVTFNKKMEKPGGFILFIIYMILQKIYDKY